MKKITVALLFSLLNYEISYSQEGKSILTDSSIVYGLVRQDSYVQWGKVKDCRIESEK